MKIREMLEKKMKEKQKKQRAKLVMKVTVGAIAGIATGVVGGVLMAPKSGRETRDNIAKTAKDLGENVISKTEEIKETLDNKVTKTKNNAAMAKEKISKYLSDRKVERNENKNENEVVVEESNEIEAIAKTEE